jgi:hypothetical protein
LPPIRSRFYLIALAIAAILAAKAVVGPISLFMLGHFQSTHARLLGMRELLQSMVDLLGPNPRSVENTIGALVSARPSDLLILGLAGALALYLVLRPVVPAFQLKRLLLNTYPTSDEGLAARPLHWTTSRALGIYELEDELFRTLQGRRPRELPLDLIVSGLILVAPLAIWALMTVRVILLRLTAGRALGLRLPPGASYRFVYGSLLIWTLILLLLPCLRLTWLILSWRERTGQLDVAKGMHRKFSRPLMVGLVQCGGLLALATVPITDSPLIGIFGSLTLGIWAARTISRVRALTGYASGEAVATSSLALRWATYLSWLMVAFALVSIVGIGVWFSSDHSLHLAGQTFVWSVLLLPFLGLYYVARDLEIARRQYGAAERSLPSGAWVGLLIYPVLIAPTPKASSKSIQGRSFGAATPGLRPRVRTSSLPSARRSSAAARTCARRRLRDGLTDLSKPRCNGPARVIVALSVLRDQVIALLLAGVRSSGHAQ